MPHPDMNEFWTNGHPDEGLLHEWLDEQLSAADASTVAAHVASCAECSAAVAEARGLIAASHRILAALDDVPSGVIPQNMQHAEQVSDASIDFNKRVEELRTARASVASVTHPRSVQRSARWRQAGKVAALLLIAIVPGVYFLRGEDVTVPMAASGASTLATTERAIAQSAAVAPQAKSDVGADSAAPAPLGKGASVAASQVASAPAASAPATASAPQARQLRDDAATRNVAERGVGFASRASADANAGAGGPVITAEAAKKAASSTAVKAEDLPVPVTSDLPLSGKVAGAAIASVDRAQSATSARPPSQTVIASPTAPAASPTIPQVANAPAPVAPSAARTQLPDTLGSTQAIAAAVRRTAEAEAIREAQPIGARALTRADVSPASAVAPFDSVVLTRTVCGASCETSVLRVMLNGNARFTVSSGSVQSVSVTAQLSSAERSRLREAIQTTVPGAFGASESVRCTVSRSTGAPSFDLLVARTPPRIISRGEVSQNRCATDGELLKLGATIDSIAHTAELRRKTP